MKKIHFLQSVFILFLMISFSSCEEIVEVDLPEGEPKLIVDAIFEVYFNENPVSAKTEVRLTTSAPYFNDNIPMVLNATVFITDLSNNTIVPFSDANNGGTYTPTTNFIPQDNVDYELTIIHDGETYTAINKKIKSPVINNVIQGDETLFTGEEVQVNISFTDDVAQENYYVFSLDKNLYVPIEDRFFNGSDYEFSFFYQEDEIKLPETVTIKLTATTKDFYDYFRVLLNQSGQNSGGPFQTTPASLLGNVVNQTGFKNFPLGYFHIAETDRVDLNLVEN